MYLENGNIHWFNLLVPFGMSVLVIASVIIKMIQEKNGN